MSNKVADSFETTDRTVAERPHSLGTALLSVIQIREVGLIVILILMSTVLTFLAPKSFPTAYNIFNVLRFVSYITISAFGECMVIITAGIDLSVGSVMGLSGITGAKAMVLGAPTSIGVLVGLATGAFCGLVNGFLISKVKMQPFIVTLGTMSIVRGLCYGITGGWPIPSRGFAGVQDLPDSFVTLGQGMALDTVPYPVIFMLILGLIATFFLTRTIRGRHIYATGGNIEAARLAGISTDNIKLLVYVLCGLLAGVAGILMAARLGTADPRGGETYELDVIAAVVLGGTSLMGGEGSIPGLILAAAFMGLIRNGLTLIRVDPYWQPLAIGCVIILGAWIDQITKGRREE